jgi:hypothetical protein
MTRKDYALIAKAIVDARKSVNSDPRMVEAVNIVADEIATALEGDNSLFDRIRFLTAAGVP